VLCHPHSNPRSETEVMRLFINSIVGVVH